MKLSGSKKIILLGIILLIIAGIVVVALKGVKVSLILQQHEEINIYIGKPTDIQDMKSICKEVFKDKRFIVRDLDIFTDAYSINVESVINEEKDELISKVNEKFGVNITTDDISEKTVSNIRVRDIVKPYVKPALISAVLMAVYVVIRFRKENAFKLLGKILGIIILTEAVIFSVIAVLRIPLSATMINLMAVIAVVELCLYINKLETKKLGKNEKYK